MRKLFIICAVLLTAACAKEIEELKVYELGCPEPEREAGAEAGSVVWEIYSNVEYTAEINADWMSVREHPQQLTFAACGDGQLIVDYGHNTEDTRTGTITLSIPGREVTLTLIQTGDKTPPVTIEVEHLAEAATSSTLTFAFGEGKTEAEQYGKPYMFGLFRNRECTDTVVYHHVPAGSAIWKKKKPAFTFAGLDPETVYYFSAKDTSSVEGPVINQSEVVEAVTLAFTVVEPVEEIPAPGDVVLAEDFSILPWNGDEVNGAAGFRASDVTQFVSPSGEYPEGGFGARDYECELFAAGGTALAVEQSRLAGWSVLAQKGAPANRQKMIFLRPGYVKMGGYSYSANLVSPPIGVMPAGMLANIKVDFTASRYSTSDSENIIVSVVEGSQKDNLFTLSSRVDRQVDLDPAVGWKSYTVTFANVRPGSRVLIGPDFEKTGYGNGKVQQRMFLNDITVTVESFVDNGQKVEAELVDAGTSTLTFSFGEGSTDKEKASYEYSVALYEDEACQQLVVRHVVDEIITNNKTGDDKVVALWVDKLPKFTFAGLQQNKTYYFQAVNMESGKKSDAVAAVTDPFEVVKSGDVEAAAGTVILSEDFSELAWNGDDINGAAGFRSSDMTSFVSPSGDSPEGFFGNSSFECPLFAASGFSGAVAASRLADWSIWNHSGIPAASRLNPILARPGYLKVGGYQWSPAIVTPQLQAVPAGKIARIKVEFTASAYSSTERYAMVSMTKGTAEDYVFASEGQSVEKAVELDSEKGWSSYSVEFDDVTSDSRIMIGPDVSKSGGKGQGSGNFRIYLDDVKVTVLELKEDVAPMGVAVKRLYYSDAYVSWVANSSSESFNVYLNGELLAGDLPAGTEEYHITGLENAAKYEVVVSAMSSGEEMPAAPIEFTTKGVRVVEQARTHVCVEWDDLVNTAVVTPWTSAGSLAEGQDRAYVMELYSDAQCNNPVITLHPYDGINVARFSFNDGMGNKDKQYWNGIVDGVPRRVATRVSIGCLAPGTDYWFRVRSMENLNVTGPKGDKVMTNPAGTSEWSAPVKLTTASERNAAANEILYRGFDEYTVQKDMHNQCPGIQPSFLTTDERLNFAKTADKLGYSFGLCSYYGMGHFYKTHDFGWLTALDGTDTSYDTGAKFDGIKNYVDTEGWHVIGNTAPEMGYLHIDATAGFGIGTPALSGSLLSYEGTACALSFKAFAIHSSLRKDAEITVYVSVIRGGAKVNTVELKLPYRYANASPTATDYIPDTEWVNLSTDLELKKGDAVLIQNGVGYRWMIDDILLIKK